MAIPPFDALGFLPVGIYDANLADVVMRFGQFRSTDHRAELGKRLTTFVSALVSTGLVKEVFVDGSFVTAANRPSDVDLILVLRSNHDFSATLSPFDYSVLSRRRVRAKFKFDILIAPAESTALSQYVTYFQQVKGMPGQRKGIVRLTL